MLLDRRLLLNLTLYRTDLDDFQERSFDGVSLIIRNAGSIRAQGVEFEGQARPTRHLAIEFAAAYLDAKFTKNPFAPGLPACNNTAASCPTVQNLKGRPATFSPRWQSNFGVTYTTSPFGGGFTVSIRGDVAYTGRFYSTPDLNPQSVVDSYATYAGRLTLTSPDESWSVALFGENLTNAHEFRLKGPVVLDAVLGVRTPATGATLRRGVIGPPRTWGARIAKTF